MTFQSLPSWANGLDKEATYFEGFVDNLDVLEHHKRETLTTGGIRRSSGPRK